MTLTEGSVATGFEIVADAFAANFARNGELGAACSVYLNGRPVVDIWGGVADASTGRRWDRSTAVPVFSVTKGALAACVNVLIERGTLDPDAHIADYWPEFGANGKQDILLRWVLSHRAGVPTIDAPATLADIANWKGIVQAVAAQSPSWPPGTSHGYHPRSFGWILGEVIRRATGRTPGQFFATEIAEPLGLEWWIGLPLEVEALLARVAPPFPGDTALSADGRNADLRNRALGGPSDLFAYDDRWNTAPYLRPEIPSSNGVATARAVARMYAALIGEVDGIRLVNAATVDRLRAVEVDGPDVILGRRSTFGLGFALHPGLGRFCPPGAFGHPGAGGSLGFADPASGLAFGYVTDQLRLGVEEAARADELVAAAYSVVNPRARARATWSRRARTGTNDPSPGPARSR